MSNFDKPESILNSLCRIISPTETGIFVSTGTFILPHLVLTSAHSVTGTDVGDIIISNRVGQASKIQLKRHGGTNRIDTKSDLALVELHEPIGPKGRNVYVPVLTTQVRKKYGHMSEGFIATNFSSDALQEDSGIHAVRLNYQFTLHARKHAPNQPEEDYYKAKFELGTGHSGSPIIDNDGRVVSILSGGFMEENLNQGEVLEDYGLDFFAPSQAKFAEFMSWALE